MPLPAALGTTRTWPTTRLGSSIPFSRQDVGGLDVVAVGDRLEGVRGLDRQDQTGHRRDREDLADVEVVLRLQLVRPPDGHHRDVELAGDPGQGVSGPDPVGPQQGLAVGDRGIDRDGLEERAILEERALDDGLVHCQGIRGSQFGGQRRLTGIRRIDGTRARPGAGRRRWRDEARGHRLRVRRSGRRRSRRRWRRTPPGRSRRLKRQGLALARSGRTRLRRSGLAEGTARRRTRVGIRCAKPATSRSRSRISAAMARLRIWIVAGVWASLLGRRSRPMTRCTPTGALSNTVSWRRTVRGALRSLGDGLRTVRGRGFELGSLLRGRRPLTTG